MIKIFVQTLHHFSLSNGGGGESDKTCVGLGGQVFLDDIGETCPNTGTKKFREESTMDDAITKLPSL